MKLVRNRRRLAELGALGTLIAVTLFVVLPAFASNPGDFVSPPSGAGVTPYDVAVGGNKDCRSLFTGANSLGAGISEYDNVNPKTASGLKSGNGDGVTFDLTMHTPSSKNQTLDVSSSGAAILGIGIKGGTQSTAYNYKVYKQPPGYVMSDSALHSPAQSWTSTTSGTTTTETPSQFYSLSQLTVCYAPLSYIQGTVYQDTNQNGTNDDNSPLSGWTVRLYAGVTPGTAGAGGGTVIASQQTDSNGGYHFGIPVDGTHYRVCEVPNGTPPTGANGVWVESQPDPSTTTLCNGTGELAKGYDFTPTSSTGATDDFGNVGGYPCSQAGAQVGVNAYTVGECKQDQLYVFNSGSVTGGQYNGAPFVDYWVGDPSQTQIPVVEQINLNDPINAATGLPTYTKLLYADGGGFPVTYNNLVTMPYCLVDPRNQAGRDGYALQQQYAMASGSSSVLPSGQTSCVISIKTIAPATVGGTGTLQAYVYALGDSVRVGN